MDDQERLAKKSMYLSLKEFYSHNPYMFIKAFYPDIKLNLWQKIIITMVAEKRYKNKYRLKLMEEMKMDYEVWKPDCIEIYEKGTLIKIIKNKCPVCGSKLVITHTDYLESQLAELAEECQSCGLEYQYAYGADRLLFGRRWVSLDDNSLKMFLYITAWKLVFWFRKLRFGKLKGVE